ncbi:hypothetical protein EZH22_06215 [Xanthobacter dioxanivorans]|uniref:Uncharacterized protein n=1 Tax=Xanthobacter dioxanivorans TaxID=2528964 RepID=A0A974PQK9_9HYPH|nr:hypothetical protein [Xanthobacter dioxanivorans]QRG07949.1 hypothetical protein EZH22_06215 [Xanthobacter dioxanivorans]
MTRPLPAAPPVHAEPTAVHAVPAAPLEAGFRLLVMREFAAAAAPASFAVIEQRLLRPPPRQIRHGIAFALAFRPEVMAFLGFHLGRPAVPGPDGARARNPLWPRLAWHKQARPWPDDTLTTEWNADILFPQETARAAFAHQFHAELAGIPPP